MLKTVSLSVARLSESSLDACTSRGQKGLRLVWRNCHSLRCLNDVFHPCNPWLIFKEDFSHGPTRNFTDVARISEACAFKLDSESRATVGETNSTRRVERRRWSLEADMSRGQKGLRLVWRTAILSDVLTMSFIRANP
jgi:hypothetical protein